MAPPRPTEAHGCVSKQQLPVPNQAVQVELGLVTSKITEFSDSALWSRFKKGKGSFRGV